MHVFISQDADGRIYSRVTVDMGIDSCFSESDTTHFKRFSLRSTHSVHLLQASTRSFNDRTLFLL